MQTRKPHDKTFKSAKGHSANSTRHSSENSDSQTALVCMAHVTRLDKAFMAHRVFNYNEDPHLPRPLPAPRPIIGIDFTGEQLLDTDQFISLIFRIDPSVFHPGLETAIRAGILPQHIETSFESLSEPLWIMTHNVPLVDLGTQFAAVLYPETRARPVFTKGIIPLLHRVFNLQPETLPFCFRRWHSLAHAYISHRLEHCNRTGNYAVTVTHRHETLAVTFYPSEAPPTNPNTRKGTIQHQF